MACIVHGPLIVLSTGGRDCCPSRLTFLIWQVISAGRSPFFESCEALGLLYLHATVLPLRQA
jgi:hypothetical protein